MNKLRISEFGSLILREVAQPIPTEDITTPKIKQLIAGMKALLVERELGVGLAAPQVGVSLAIAVIAIRPSVRRPDAMPFDLVIINPKILETFGNRKQLYEGCISGGPGKAGIYARVPRYQKIRLRYQDEAGLFHEKKFDGLIAHIIQHEVDHLNGILFVDKVKDTRSYITYKEYMKLATKSAPKSKM